MSFLTSVFCVCVAVVVRQLSKGEEMEEDEANNELLSDPAAAPRIISKTGKCNIILKGDGNRKRFLQDFFTTLIDAQWRWILLAVSISFVSTWFLFTLIWYLIAYLHGDLDPLNLSKINSNWKPCVQNMETFAAAFLFSLETQTTIGYGERYVTDKCPDALIMLSIQSIFNVLLEAFVGGAIITKLLRSKRRMNTVIFSRKAVICKRDGQLYFVCRIGDIQKSNIITIQVKSVIVEKFNTNDSSESQFPIQREMKMGVHCSEDADIFLWPMELVHRIDEDSPLYNISKDDFYSGRYEIIVALEGCAESTGMPIQCRTSYLPCEVMWGHRFAPMITKRLGEKKYILDYSLFHTTQPIGKISTVADHASMESQ